MVGEELYSVKKQNVNTPKDYYKNGDLAQNRKIEHFQSCKITFFFFFSFCNLLTFLGITSQMH